MSPSDPQGGQQRRIRVLWNPSSGRKAGIPTGSASRETLEALLAHHELGGELIETGSEEIATDAARDAVARGYDMNWRARCTRG